MSRDDSTTYNLDLMWQEQWALFAENFHDGKAHISIGDKTLLLLPGPGFGDLSHPTTRLMMQLMPEAVLESSVVDLGTGSGILSLAALLMGAKSAFGIDIDERALEHARKNGELNALNASFETTLPPNIGRGHLFLMNMIFPEQKALDPAQYNKNAKLWITSGILASQKEDYLATTKTWGWELVKCVEESEWCGFIFQ